MSEDVDLEDASGAESAITPDVGVVREHLIVHLGAPYEVAELRRNPVKGSPIEMLEIAYFAPGGMQAPVLFSTCGLSQSLMENGRRMEGIFMMRPAPAKPQLVYDLLSAFALYPDKNQVSIGIGDVLPGGAELEALCPMDALLVLPPVQFVEGFQRIPRWDQQIVDLFWLVPVFEQEAAYALQHGPEALLMLFAAQGLDLTDLKRDEANTVMTPEDAAEMARKRELEDKKRPRPTARMAAPQPMMKRRPQPTSKSFEAQEADDGAFVVRRKGIKTAPPDASTVVDRPVHKPQEASSAQDAQAARAPSLPGGPKRFDVPKKDKPARPVLTSKPKEARDPEAEKKARIEALKADAKARAERAKKDRQGGD